MTNDSARGYIILALKSLDYDNEEIEKILRELRFQFDTVNEITAEEFYNNGNWREE